ncbi:hypothetical protein [Limnoglobus roseus]|uniref:Uncharacterized protein n=1 Tax=Limnoglobus roseus TaxID=2598579 RepID=A0A5C1AEL1_9BACT|nr:hypothetical protein [Limnoglobus roseus]QEL17721.1 hypothetical protein PX52LOC_04720 [Limnoglobus roseus]
MSDAVAVTKKPAKKKPATKKPTPKKAVLKKSPPAVESDPAADLMAGWDKPTGFEEVNEAIEDLKHFVQTLDSWDAEDCLRMMVNLGLLSRLVDRIERGNNYVLLSKNNDLDNALDRRLGPVGNLRRTGIC